MNTKNRIDREVPFDGALEQLEARTLFSAPYEFAAVGFRFDAGSGPSVFEMLGTMARDGGVTGTQTLAQRTGSPTSGPIDFASFQVLSNGRLNTAPRSGVGAYQTQSADNFVSDLGYPFGSLFGEFTGGPTDVAFMLERSNEHPIQWTGVYDFQYLEFTDAGFSIHAGRFFVSGTTVMWSDEADGDNQQFISLTDGDAFGSLTMADGRRLHTSPWHAPLNNMNFEDRYEAGGIAFIVDTDNSDGKIGIGIARKQDEIQPAQNQLTFGLHRATILTNGGLATDFFSAQSLSHGVAAARVAIDLRPGGQYAIYDLASYDAGGRTPLSTGTWEATINTEEAHSRIVILRDDQSDNVAYFTVSADYALVPAFVTTPDGGTVEEMTGSAVAFTPIEFDRYLQGGHVALDENGHPVFYFSAIEQLYVGDGDQFADWYAEDLLEAWGGKPLVAVDSIEGLADNFFEVVGVATDGDVLTWQRMPNGRWIFRNLTEELGADGVVSDLTIFQHSGLDAGFAAGQYHALAVAGKSSGGDIILYTPNLIDFDSYGRHQWGARNVTDTGLTPEGQPTPVWTGAIQGYNTNWGGLNIVGLDAAGDLIVVWTAPGLPGWYTNNLSEISNTPALAGSISVILTDWSGIHIHALDSDGNVHSTWWVPQLEGNWLHNNLTDELAGPPLDISRNTDRTEAFTTFIGVGNTLNIVGFDADGRVKVYWWSPQTNIWLVGDITNSFPPSEAPLGFASSDSLGGVDPEGGYSMTGQSLYGYNDDDSVSRVWWAPDGPDLWHVENLTALAIPIVD